MKIIIFIFEIVLDSSNAEIFMPWQTESVKISEENFLNGRKKRGPAVGGAFFELTPMKIQK